MSRLRGSSIGKVVEYHVWLALALVPLLQPFIAYGLRDRTTFDDTQAELHFVSDNLGYIIFSFLIAVFPLVYQIIFGELPFQTIRAKIQRSRENVEAEAETEIGIRLNALTTSLDGLDIKRARARTSDFNSHQLLSLYALESAKAAKSVQSRAGVFLLVGTIISMSGLAFFYYYNNGLSLPEKFGTVDRLVIRIPGIAILFFIEFVALFFLRLFKSTFDEYRYF